MAVQYDAEPEDDGWSALCSNGSQSQLAAEVVEMVETNCNNGTSSRQALTDNHNTKSRERKLDRYRDRYDKGHRDKIVSKYQKRKETKRYPASATNSNISLSGDEEGRFKAENKNVNDAPKSAAGTDDLRDTCIVNSISRSDSLPSCCSKSGQTSTSDSVESYQHQTQPTNLSDSVSRCNQSRAESIQDTGQVLHSVVIARNGVPLHRLSATAEGETDTESSCEQTAVCLTSNRSTLPSAAPGFCEGAATQPSSVVPGPDEAVGTNMQVDFEDISVDAASAEQGENHCDMQVQASLSCPGTKGETMGENSSVFIQRFVKLKCGYGEHCILTISRIKEKRRKKISFHNPFRSVQLTTSRSMFSKVSICAHVAGSC